MKQEVVRWQCDKCGREENTESGKVPAGWKMVRILPLGAGNNRAIREAEVCKGCYDQIDRFIQNQNQPSTSSDHSEGRQHPSNIGLQPLE